MKRTVSANVNSKSNSGRANSTGGRGYAMCIDNDGYPASLEVGKVYRMLKTDSGMPDGWLRIVDESGEDYLYPAKRFVPVDLPPKGRRALAAAR